MARTPEHFYFGGVDSLDYGVYLRDAIKISGASPNMDTISIPGRNGDLIRYDGSYRNVEFSASCFVRTENETDAESALAAAKAWLAGQAGYRRLELPWEDGYRMAYVTEIPGTEAVGRHVRTFSCTFSCKPQVYTYEGEQTVTVYSGGTLYNRGMTALPLITLYGSGAGTLTIGETVVTIKELSGSLTLDCEIQDAYKGTENWNGKISASSFPVLLPGENKISMSGGVRQADIIPRWWHL